MKHRKKIIWLNHFRRCFYEIARDGIHFAVSFASHGMVWQSDDCDDFIGSPYCTFENLFMRYYTCETVIALRKSHRIFHCSYLAWTSLDTLILSGVCHIQIGIFISIYVIFWYTSCNLHMVSDDYLTIRRTSIRQNSLLHFWHIREKVVRQWMNST